MTSLPLGTLIAEDARDADRPAGACAVCQRPARTGDRIARLVIARPGALIHAGCAGKIGRR